MAFQNIRVKMNFVLGTVGWSESFYRSASQIGQAEIDKAFELIAKRKPLLVNVARVTSVAITASQQKRLSQRIRVPAGAGQNTSNRDVSAVTIAIPFLSSGGHLRTYQLHGVPDDSNSFDAAGNENIGLGPNLQAYLDYLVLPANGWQMRVQSIGAGDQGLVKVEDITVLNGVVTFKAANLVLVQGQKVIISNAEGFKAGQFNGEWTVGSYTDPNIVSSTARLTDPEFFYVKSSASIRPVTATFFVFEQLSSYQALNVRGATRRVGRPPDAPRGA